MNNNWFCLLTTVTYMHYDDACGVTAICVTRFHGKFRHGIRSSISHWWIEYLIFLKVYFTQVLEMCQLFQAQPTLYVGIIELTDFNADLISLPRKHSIHSFLLTHSHPHDAYFHLEATKHCPGPMILWHDAGQYVLYVLNDLISTGYPISPTSYS